MSDAALLSAVKELRHALGDDGTHQRCVQTLRGSGYQFIAPVEERSNVSASAVRSLALLPLADLSGDAGFGHLARGMTEALVGELVALESLRILSHKSAATLAASEKSLPELGAELGIEFALTGSVTCSRGRIRLCVQLLDVRDDCHIWAEHYDRDLEDVLSLESDLARDVAEEVEARLGDTERGVCPSG